MWFLLNDRLLIAQPQWFYVGIMQGNSKKMRAKNAWKLACRIFSKDGSFLKTGRISCLFCVRITDSSHTSFPLTFVPVAISVRLKYPVPCCLCGSWGQSRCFCIGSWSLWWVILFKYILKPFFSIFSHPKYSTPYSVKWSVMTCLVGMCMRNSNLYSSVAAARISSPRL